MHSKGNNKQKGSSQIGRKIFANDVKVTSFDDKVRVSRIYKQLIKTNNLIDKWAEDLNKHFSKEDLPKMAKRHVKRLSRLIIIREIKLQ